MQQLEAIYYETRIPYDQSYLGFRGYQLSVKTFSNLQLLNYRSSKRQHIS